MPPQLVNKSDETISVSAGSDITPYCEAEGNPDPTINWYHYQTNQDRKCKNNTFSAFRAFRPDYISTYFWGGNNQTGFTIRPTKTVSSIKACISAFGAFRSNYILAFIWVSKNCLGPNSLEKGIPLISTTIKSFLELFAQLRRIQIHLSTGITIKPTKTESVSRDHQNRRPVGPGPTENRSGR